MKRVPIVVGLVLTLVGGAVPFGADAVAASSGTYRVTARLATGELPSGVAIDPVTHTAFVANWITGTVSVIDEATRTVTGAAEVSYGYGVAVDPARREVYVAHYGTIEVVDETSLTIVGSINIGVATKDLAIDPVAHTLWVTDQDDGFVSIADLDTRMLVAQIPVGGYPWGVAVDPLTHVGYVTDATGTHVTVVDGRTGTVIGTVATGHQPWGVAVDPALRTVYVTNSGSNTVSVVDENTNAVTATIRVASYPFGVVVNPATHSVYVSHKSANVMSVIDERTNKVSATVDIGDSAGNLAVDPGLHTVVLSNEYSGTATLVKYYLRPSVTAVEPASGPTAGGATITVTGHRFSSGSTKVRFGAGGPLAPAVTVVSATELRVTTPPHAAGTVDVLVTTRGGTSAVTAADRYTFTDAAHTVRG